MLKNHGSKKDNNSSIIRTDTIGGKPVFYKTFFKQNNQYQPGLLQNNLDSLEVFRKELNINCNFFKWSGLMTAIPDFLKQKKMM